MTSAISVSYLHDVYLRIFCLACGWINLSHPYDIYYVMLFLRVKAWPLLRRRMFSGRDDDSVVLILLSRMLASYVLADDWRK